MPTIDTTLTADEVQEVLSDLPSVLSGEAVDPTGLVQSMWEEIAEVCLELIHDSYIAHSLGNSDDTGIVWPALSPKTLAYSRDNIPGKPHKRKGERPRGLLTDAQDATWRRIYAYTRQHLIAQGRSAKDASGNAAAHAWLVLKSQGAKTMLEVFGAANVPVLIDSGELLETLTPGSGHPDQICEVKPGEISVGSKLARADAMHDGVPAKNIPARPLWPEGPELPPSWQDRIDTVIERWTELILADLLGSRQGAMAGTP